MSGKKSISGDVGIGLGTLIIGTLLLRGCVVDGIETRLDRINQSLQNQPRYELQLKRENVLGGEAPEEFYDINGRRVYLKIDDKPIEDLYK